MSHPGRQMPGTNHLRRLLNHLFTKPVEEIFFLEEIQQIEDDFEHETEEKIALFRAAIYKRKNLQHIGLFEFLVGLAFLNEERYQQAEIQFLRARQQWSFLKERPHICLAQFAEGLSAHLANKRKVALKHYMRVEELLIRIDDDLVEPALIRPLADYKKFSKELNIQLKKAEATLRQSLALTPPPRVSNGLKGYPTPPPGGQMVIEQTDSQPQQSRHVAQGISQKIAQSDVASLKSLQGQIRWPSLANYLGFVIATMEKLHQAEEQLQHDLQYQQRNSSSGWTQSKERLSRLLHEHFTAAELKKICFESGISYDWLPGERKATKVKALVSFCWNHNRLTEFLQNARRCRPDVPLGDFIRS